MFFYLIEKHSKFLLHTLQMLYMYTLCDSTNNNTIVKLVPNCLYHVSGDGFKGGSDSNLQFRDTLREEEEHKPDPWRDPIQRNHMGLHLENEVAVVKTPTIISNNPVRKPLSKFRLCSWMAEGMRKMNPKGCGQKLSQSTDLEYYPDTTGGTWPLKPYNIQGHRTRIRAESS